jgi:hypothetical protein
MVRSEPVQIAIRINTLLVSDAVTARLIPASHQESGLVLFADKR